MHATADRLAAGTADQPTKPTLFEIAADLGVDAAELRAYLDDEPALSPARILGWARADPAQHLDTLVEYLNRNDHRTVGVSR